MLLVVDNGSVFTTKISDFLGTNNIPYDLKIFSKIDFNTIQKYDSFILSGRKSNDKFMNAINSKIIQHCVTKSKKLLGICYGAELLVLTLGGTIRKMPLLLKGNEKIISTKSNLLISDSINVYESHSYELAKLGSILESVASSESCAHEIIQHKEKKIFGTQFHPEMSDDGKGLIATFLKL